MACWVYVYLRYKFSVTDKSTTKIISLGSLYYKNFS